MELFEKFTLCCVVIVIASVSVILVASVQLMHRLEDGINRDNSKLLQKIGAPRTGSDLYTGRESNAFEGPLLVLIIRSSKENYALRRTIRRTWAREDSRVEHRFVLRSGTYRPKHLSTDEDELDAWLKALQHRETVATNARYVLFVNESVFVNTPLLLEAIERVLPKEAFVLCTPMQTSVPERNVTCNTSNPVLVSMDVVRGGTAQNHTVHDGRRLYLNRRETEALVRHQVDDVSGLTFFFTGSLLRFSAKIPLTRMIDQLWTSTGGNDTPVEY
uniref:Hexosyltransferase n=1 Tax=Anopheles maculatus TaxID=74869 RepID=A0A182S919_9DIPT